MEKLTLPTNEYKSCTCSNGLCECIGHPFIVGKGNGPCSNPVEVEVRYFWGITSICNECQHWRDVIRDEMEDLY